MEGTRGQGREIGGCGRWTARRQLGSAQGFKETRRDDAGEFYALSGTVQNARGGKTNAVWQISDTDTGQSVPERFGRREGDSGRIIQQQDGAGGEAGGGATGPVAREHQHQRP